MTVETNIRLLVVFFAAFSLAALSGPLASEFRLPSILLGHATVIGQGSPLCQTTGSSGACSEHWYPAGPSMSTLTVQVFASATAEYNNLLSLSPTIDFPDSPIPPAILFGTGSQLGGPGYIVTDQIPAQSYNEIQFMMANTFWNCNFQFSNSACGINIRQGIAHMIDKTIFAAQTSGLQPGTGVPLDNPVPTSAGGSLLSPDSCLYDPMFPQTNNPGSLCSVGAGIQGSIGGGSYHLGSATGASSFLWLQAPGSWDLDAAAAHFVAAGLAIGCDGGTGPSSCATSTGPVSTDSKLTGISAPTCTTTCPNFFISSWDPARVQLGDSVAEAICYLFTGTFAAPCSYLTVTHGLINTFPGFATCASTICTQTWWMYTAAYNGVSFYDLSLYYTYNSRFVSASCASPGTVSCGTQQIGGGPCSNFSVPTASGSNYMYICNPTYDGQSTTLETSSCLSAPGDPVAGAISNLPTSPGNGLCAGSGLSSHSAGIAAEATFGSNVLTLPVFEVKERFAYLQCQPPGPCNSSNSWIRVINDAGVGIPNYFTWLDAYNPGPATPGTIRQGFAQTTRNVNPYIASSPQDLYIVNNIYDHLMVQNPLSTSQYIDWMGMTLQTLTSVSYNGGLSGPPPGTAVTYRFTLRPDLTFQDGRPVTSYDVAFSYLSEVGSGSFLGNTASTMTGITIMGPTVFDLAVNSTGPFVLPNLTSIPIVPGRYWTNMGSTAWDNATATCSSKNCSTVQYTLSGSTVNCKGSCTNFPASLLTINPTDTTPTFDPTKSSALIGSGPWQCGTGSTLGATCYTGNSANGAMSYTFTAYTNFFRSSQRLAMYLWSGESDTNAIGPATAVGSCFNMAVNLTGPCGRYQQGAGNPGMGSSVSVVTVGNVDIFFNLNWVAPFEWATNPPTGIAPLPPLLFGLMAFDGSTTYTPNPGGNSCTIPNTYYDC